MKIKLISSFLFSVGVTGIILLMGYYDVIELMSSLYYVLFFIGLFIFWFFWQVLLNQLKKEK